MLIRERRTRDGSGELRVQLEPAALCSLCPLLYCLNTLVRIRCELLQNPDSVFRLYRARQKGVFQSSPEIVKNVRGHAKSAGKLGRTLFGDVIAIQAVKPDELITRSRQDRLPRGITLRVGERRGCLDDYDPRS